MQLSDHDIRDPSVRIETQRKSNQLVRPKKMPKMHDGSLKKFCPLLLSVFSWFHKTRKEKNASDEQWWSSGIFQISSSSTHVAASISSFIHIDYSDPAIFHPSSSRFFFSFASYLNLIITSIKGTDSSHNLATIRRGQSARRWRHRGKIPARTKKRKRTRIPSWNLRFSSLLSSGLR